MWEQRKLNFSFSYKTQLLMAGQGGNAVFLRVSVNWEVSSTGWRAWATNALTSCRMLLKPQTCRNCISCEVGGPGAEWEMHRDALHLDFLKAQWWCSFMEQPQLFPNYPRDLQGIFFLLNGYGFHRKKLSRSPHTCCTILGNKLATGCSWRSIKQAIFVR